MFGPGIDSSIFQQIKDKNPQNRAIAKAIIQVLSLSKKNQMQKNKQIIDNNSIIKNGILKPDVQIIVGTV